MANTAEKARERFTNFTPYEAKKGEEYMSPEMLQHFRELLMQWRQELMEEVDRTMHHMQEDAANYADPSDRASQEEEFSLELRTRDRERKLIKKIGNMQKAVVLYKPLPKLLETLKRSGLSNFVKLKEPAQPVGSQQTC